MTTLVCPLCRIAIAPPEHQCPRDGSEGVPHAFEALPIALGGRFRVVMPFAGSESASSFVADCLSTGQRGLLKIYGRPRPARDPELLRIRRELDKQQRLASPYLLVPWESGDSEGTQWVFRRWLDGVSLAVVLSRRQALPAREALGIAAQLTVALEALHGQGLLHRDLRPGHVFLEARPGAAPRVQLLDAGLPNVRQRTNGPPVVGTPGYSAPEQLLGKLVSMRSDLYSLGVLIAEMLSGSRAFGDPDPEAQLQAQLRGVRPTLSDGLAESVRGMVDALVTSDAQRRPFSAQKLRRTLDAYLVEGAPVTRQPTSTFSTSSGAPAQPGQPATEGVPGRMPSPPIPTGRPSASPPPPPPAATHSARPPALTGRPATRAPVPPPPPSRRADETQQLDEGLLEELVPAPKAAPPAPPQRPRVAEKPARANEDYTVPVRLDQILAVSHTPRASAPPLPVPPSASAAGVAAPAAAPAASVPAPSPEPAPSATAPKQHEQAPAPLAATLPASAAMLPAQAAPGQGVAALPPPPALPPPAALGSSARKPTSMPPHTGTLFDSEAHVSAPASAAAVAKTVPVGPAQAAPRGDESQAPTRDFAPVEAHKRTSLGMPSPLLDALVGGDDADDDALSAAATQVTNAPRKPDPVDGSLPLTPASLAFSSSMSADLTEPRADALTEPSAGLAPDLSAAVTTLVSTRSEPPLAALLEPEDPGVRARAPVAAAAAGGEAGNRGMAPDEITQPVRELQTSVRPTSDDTRKYLVYGAAAAAALLLGFGARALLRSGSPPSAAVDEPAAVESAPAAAEPSAPSAPPKLAAIDDGEEDGEPVAAPAAAATAAAPSEPSVTALPSAPAPRVEPAPAQAPTEPAVDAPKAPADKHAASAGGARTAKEARAERHGAREKPGAAPKPKAEGSKESSLAQWSAARDEARAAFAAHNYRKAADAYERATRANPSDPGTFAGLGAARLQLHDARGAVDAYQHAVQASPNTAGFHVMLARAYEASGDSAHARASYKRALALDPQNANVSAALDKLK